MAVLTCRVTRRDGHGVDHSVEVSAQSLYEAVAQALRIFQESDWTEALEAGASAVVVRIKQPEVEHTVRIRDFRNWLEASGRSPAEMALKKWRSRRGGSKFWVADFQFLGILGPPACGQSPLAPQASCSLQHVREQRIGQLQGQRVAIARRRDFNGLVNARLVLIAVPKNSELAHNTDRTPRTTWLPWELRPRQPYPLALVSADK